MLKKIVLLIGFPLLLILISGCSNLIDTQKKNFARCKSLLDGREWYRCFADSFENISQCENLTGYIFEQDGAVLYDHHFCDTVFAIKQDDYTVCDGNAFSFSHYYSPGICLSELAFFNNNISICSNALSLYEEGLEEKELCLQKFAINNRDYGICNLITDGVVFKECFAGVAIERADREKCKEIQDRGFREHCLPYIPVT